MRLGLAIMKVFGYRISILVGYLAGMYFFVTGSISRGASLEYQRQLHGFQAEALPRPGLRNALRHHMAFAVNVVDRMWFWQGRLNHFQFTSSGKEHVLNRTSGMLLFGAHMGSFDAMRAFSMEKKMRLNVIMYRAQAAKFNLLLKHLNPDSAVEIFEMGEDSVDQIFELKERLDRGELLAILADRPPPVGRKRVAPLSFLGKEAPFPQGPWILASLLECPVVMINCLRLKLRHYHIQVEPIAEKVTLPRKTRAESLQTYMRSYVDKLEQLCVKYPFQWFNFYDFWVDHG